MGALHMASRVSGGQHATSAICELVRDLTDPAPKIALITALEQRGDETAVPTLILMADSDDKKVRAAAINALGSLGGATAVPALAKAATSGRDAEQDAARHAMLRFNGADVADALLNQMATGSPGERREVARALVARAEPGTTQKLFQLITLEQSKVSNLALETIGRIATEKDVPRLVDIVAQTSDTAIRTDAGSALAKTCARLTGKGIEPDAAPFLEAFRRADLQAHIMLLPSAVMLQDARVRQYVRQDLTTSTLPLKEAAVKSLLDARDVEYVPDLLAIVMQSEDTQLRIRLLRAALRLAADRSLFPEDNKRQIELLKWIAPLATRPEEKWALLGGLAETGSREALELAVPMLDDDATRAEALQAVARLVLALPPQEGEFARPALLKVLDTATDSAMRATADTALKHIGKMTE
jgi:HEAT repeat protein